jgi:CheY-like chemotaxis protein
MTYKAIIADDEKELRAYLKGLLAEIWPELIICGEAKNGKEALELVESKRPQVAFLDIRMPGLTGHDVQARLRKRGATIPVIALSAQDDVETRERARELGAMTFFRKPVDDQALLDAINWLLGKQGQRPAET